MTAGLVAVVPVFNEAVSVGGVVAGLCRLCMVVVVDDGSTDASGRRAAAAGATVVLSHPRRFGKAAALRTGFAEALRRGATSVATVDGDGQHDPGDLAQLLAAAHRLPDAVIVGDRLACEEGDRVPAPRLWAIRSADRALGWLTGASLRDTQCGFRIYPAELLRTVVLQEEGFVLETEALICAIREGYPVVSVPVRRVYPPRRRSRFRALADGARVGWFLAREAIRRTPSREIVRERPCGSGAPGRAGGAEPGS